MSTSHVISTVAMDRKQGPSTTCKGATQVSASRTGTATPGSGVSFPGPGTVLREGPMSLRERASSPGVELLPHLPFVSLERRRHAGAGRRDFHEQSAAVRRHPLHRLQAM